MNFEETETVGDSIVCMDCFDDIAPKQEEPSVWFDIAVDIVRTHDKLRRGGF
jgi:hypothetical protein